MIAKKGFVLRHVVGEYMLMPAGEDPADFSRCMLLNSVSAFVWEQLQSPRTRDGLLAALLERFSVDEATASADLDALLTQFRQMGLLEDETQEG